MANFLGLSTDELQLFLDETGEHLDTLETELLAMERGGADPERVALIFRSAHTIKGAAATVGLEGMARLTHAMETLLDQMRSEQLAPSGPIIGSLLAGVDQLRQMLTAIMSGRPPGEPPPELLDALERGEPSAPGSVHAGDRAAASGNVKVQVRLSPSCPMPAVRALQILLALEGLGQVAGSDPSQSAIEAEQVGEHLTVWLNTEAGPQTIQEALSQVPDVLESQVVAGSAVRSSDQAAPGETVVEVQISPACPMPAVRALQVLMALEGLGEVIRSDPSQAAIESERVGGSLTVWLDTDRPPTAVRTALAGIPELAQVEVTPPLAPAQAATQPAVPTLAAPETPTGSRPGGAGETRQPATAVRTSEDRTIRVDVALLDQLMNLVGELVIDRGRLAGIGQGLGLQAEHQEVADELGRVTGHLARVTTSLQETVLKARMLPIERVFRKFPRMVRDLAQQMGKEVDFQLAGEETELDRSLLEVIGDPLMHLIRNALDHGLESPADRTRSGKAATAVLRLEAAHEENHVVIRVRDDGRGIDPERIRTAAVRKGILTPERARDLGPNEAIQLLFASGFSTAEQVTDVSGRGVGLDVVRRNIERVGGRIEVESRVGVGTTFRLMLPLTLATIRALLVQVGTETFALPLRTIAETLRVAPAEMASVKGRWVTRVRGQVVPLLWMKQYVSPGFRPGRSEEPMLVVMVNHEGELVGVVVDQLVGEQEVVVKGLGDFFGQVKGVSGVTILGDGSLALIADIAGLIGVLSAENAGSGSRQFVTVAGAAH